MDTKVLELMFDGTSLTLFESTLEWDLGGRNEVVEDDLGSPTPKKASLLETALPTLCPEDSPLSHTRITSQIFVQITTISNHRNPAESGRLER